MKSVPVIVKWVGKKSENLPQGKQYITVAKFKDDLNWSEEAWSIVLDFNLSAFNQGNPSKALARFLLNDESPRQLSKGVEFELYEGADLVAVVTVE